MDATTETLSEKLARIGALFVEVTEATVPVAQLQSAGEGFARVASQNREV